MKKFFALMLSFMALAFLSETAGAQDQMRIAHFSIGGPHTDVEAINNTDIPLSVSIGEHRGIAKPHGQKYTVRYSDFMNDGDVPIEITVCKNSTSALGVVSAPTDPNFDLGDLAITDDYLRTHPDNESLRQKVGAIVAYVERRPGGKNFKKVIQEWLKYVIQNGVIQTNSTCEAAYTIATKIPGGRYEYFDKTIQVVVTKGADGKFLLTAPWPVYYY